MVGRDSGEAAGTVTFLFTDIEGSTRLLQSLPDGYGELLARHHAIVRSAIEGAEGRVVDTAGDGFFAAFQRARAAVAAAVEIQRRIDAEVFPHGARLRVRVGVHTGEPSLSAEGYVGLDVHRAARICATAAGGQILVSATTRALAESELPDGATLRDLGTHRLKDLVEPEHLYQLEVDGLEAEHPAPHSLESNRLGFPVTATPLFGRERELDSLRTALRSSGVRLITLTGAGGTGKTRLGLAACDSVADEFEQGACFVSLATITDALRVPSTIAHALGVRERPTVRTLDVLIEHLRDQQMLLMLDNFEQIIDAAPVVSTLLGSCKRLSFLVTSRIALRLTGEREFPVPTLPLPNRAIDDSAAALQKNPAVALFLDRARAVRPDFEIDDESAPAIAELCVKLDGLPLALELAAARIRVFSPHALLARIGNRLDLLKGGARDLPERHRTLRGAISWSYDLLEPAERALFRRLSAFVGGFSFEAADPVCNAAGSLGLDVIDGIASLAERSLVRRVEDVHGDPRFTMLETMREFGLEQLARHGEVIATREALARFALALGEAAAPRLAGHDQERWLDRLEAEHNNLRAAIEWFVQHDVQAALRLATALYRFWIVRGHLREGRQWLEDVLAQPAAKEPTLARAHALNALGTLAHELSALRVARPLLEESVAISRRHEDWRGVALTSTGLGWVASLLGDHRTARTIGEEASRLARELNLRRTEALALHNLSNVDLFEGRFASARENILAGLSILREIGDRRGIAYMSISLAWADRAQGHWLDAANRIEDALVTLVLLRDAQLTGWALTNRGILNLEMDEADRAVRALEEGIGMFREVGNRFAEAWATAHLAAALAETGNAYRADALAADAIDISDRTGSGASRSLSISMRGHVLAITGESARAVPYLIEGLHIALENGERPTFLRTLESCLIVLGGRDPIVSSHLLGAADRIAERLGCVRPPRMARRINALAVEMKTVLGEQRFNDAAAAGASSSLSDLVSFAERELHANTAALPR